jgi:multiple sugar transport system substrate-binding protein
MSFGMTRRSFLTAAGASALAVRGLGGPGEASGQAKPAKLSVCQEDFEPISSWVGKRFQEKYGIEVVYTTTEFTANYEKQVADMISGSTTSLYDVVQWSDPFTGVFAPKGYIEPLDAYLAKSTVVKLDQIKGPWVPAATYKGKIYGLPFHNLDMQLFYRKDVIPQAPRTYQEILEWAKKVNKSPQFYGFTGDWDDDNFWYNFRRRLYAAGGRMWDKDGNPAFNSDAGVRALQWFRDMWAAGVVFPETLRTFSGGANNKVMAAGKAAMSFNWSWANLTFEDPKLSVISGMALNPADADDQKRRRCPRAGASGLEREQVGRGIHRGVPHAGGPDVLREGARPHAGYATIGLKSGQSSRSIRAARSTPRTSFTLTYGVDFVVIGPSRTSTAPSRAAFR